MSRIALYAVSLVSLIASASWALAAGITPPADVAKAGKLVFCSDITSPPLEFFDENSNAVGSDIDIGTEIATRLGVKVEFKNTAFDAIIPSLQAKQCDAIISQLFNKPKRREVVDFVDYMYSAQSFLVAKGNPKKIMGIEDTSGLKIAVENGTTIQGLFEDQNKKFKDAGKPEATVVVFPKDTDARQALQVSQVDAYGTTLESAAYFLQKAGHVFDIAGEPFNKITAGIATRKGEADMHDAIQKAFDTMKGDGTYKKILAKWGLEGDALE
jgi:polar amino acid transport system substrate-binding protein